ncbi:hypothetical protein N7517_005116 [Penicillium concentricum]|uniref:Uncharacterized protein n=1 Tax=Penicillium concentricum TaxID=293559 RepID=A0A9W9S837_9EURO|nr:uncharacterized protein N7517_005116 [Penicillium concentricum]KAJ5373110.1 hypothetical protein N7517_005116 [Penicillium concentricum]
MNWPLAVSDNPSLFNERYQETEYLDEPSGSPFSYSQYSFLAANPNILHPTQGQAGVSNAKYTSQYSIAEGTVGTSQPMAYTAPMLGQPPPLSPQPAHSMQSTPQCMPNHDTQARSQRSRAYPIPHKADRFLSERR